MWECPIYDFSCPYFEDGGCNLRTAKADCDAWYDIVDEEDEQSSFLCPRAAGRRQKFFEKIFEKLLTNKIVYGILQTVKEDKQNIKEKEKTK